MVEVAAAVAVGSKFNNVCVFCGSSSGNTPEYGLAAAQLGAELVTRRVGLVYGGGSVGLMGAVSRQVFDQGVCLDATHPKLLSTGINFSAVQANARASLRRRKRRRRQGEAARWLWWWRR
jgi:predicted Rossmann-fold nucleotide-binding protein